MEGLVALAMPVVLMPVFLLCLNCLSQAYEEFQYRVLQHSPSRMFRSFLTAPYTWDLY